MFLNCERKVLKIHCDTVIMCFRSTMASQNSNCGKFTIRKLVHKLRLEHFSYYENKEKKVNINANHFYCYDTESKKY